MPQLAFFIEWQTGNLAQKEKRVKHQFIPKKRLWMPLLMWMFSYNLWLKIDLKMCGNLTERIPDESIIVTD